MSKKVSLLTFVAILALALLVPASKAFAASSDTVSVTVTISATISVTITEGPIDFGPLSVGATAISSGALIVTNDGSGIAETYSLSCSNTAAWDAAATASADHFVLSAQFNSDQPTSFDAVNDVLSNTPVAATATKFAGNETGVSVAHNAERDLWLEIQTPTTTAATAQQTITLTVSAEAS